MEAIHRLIVLKAASGFCSRVGDMFRFGQSTRFYVFNGPQDMMPEEGLNRSQRRLAAKLEEAQRQKEKDEEVRSCESISPLNDDTVLVCDLFV